MSTVERSLERFTDGDLERLAELAAHDRAERFRRKPRWSVYADRVICVALCQGGALHYVDGANGIKDIDVWTLYAEHPEGPFPARWLTSARALAAKAVVLLEPEGVRGVTAWPE